MAATLRADAGVMTGLEQDVDVVLHAHLTHPHLPQLRILSRQRFSICNESSTANVSVLTIAAAFSIFCELSDDNVRESAVQLRATAQATYYRAY